ncbi:MAG: ABC transporter permease [Eubacterium sp.]|nr:ABC transporter permease [Eubacterium sp.]
MNVKNKQVVREIAWMTYCAEKKRNLMAVVAIAMATFLIAVMTAVGASYWQTLSERQLRMQGIDYEISLGEPRESQVAAVRAMDKVKYAGLKVACMEVEQYQDIAIDGADFYWLDEVCWEKQVVPALEAYEGSYPAQEDELMLSTAMLRAMRVEHPSIGMKLPFTYHTMAAENPGTQVRDFRLSGWFTDYTGTEKGYVSRAFFDTTGVKQTDFELGALTISLVNPLYFPKDIAAMNKELEISGTQSIEADHDAASRFCRVIAALAAMLFMVAASAYLFIYHTMYLSIARNIRYYGQLKTIGMTSVQLKGMIYRQAVFSAIPGIAAGLFCAVAVSKQIVPKILFELGGVYEEAFAVPVSPTAFLAAGGFALLVNVISCRKPADIAGSCPPIEAMRYQPALSKRKPHRREAAGIFGMAFWNLFRDKKQTAVILLSSAVALAVFFTANVVIYANDAKHILNEAGGYDIQFVNQTMLRKEKQIFTEEKLKELAAADGVKAIRRVSSAPAAIPYQEDVFGEYYRALYDSVYSPGNYEEDIGNYKVDDTGEWTEHFFGTRFVAIDEEGFLLFNESIGNTLDQEAFERGEIAVTVEQPFVPGDFGIAGKTVRFRLPQGASPETEYSIQIAAVGTIGNSPYYFAGGYTPAIIVSEAYAKTLLDSMYIELVEADYETAYDEQAEEAAKAVFADEKKVTSSSKLDRYTSMLGAERKMKALGYSIAGIVAVLALFNYINMTAAGIQNRAKEFATLESIGMTGKQAHMVLCIEGIGYGLFSAAASLAIGLPFSSFVFRGLSSGVSYAVPWKSSLALYAAAAILSMAAPVIIYKRTQKGSVIERMRMED